MPFCGWHTSNNCGCFPVVVPVPEEQQQEQEEESVCDNCGETGDDCECVVCERRRCGTRVSPDRACSCCEYCLDCCERFSSCFTCNTCCTRREDYSYCELCHQCVFCCSCEICVECERRGDRYAVTCSNCDCCESHCECNENCAVEFRDSNGTFHTASRKEFTTNKSKRYIAVEIEVDELEKPNQAGGIENTCCKWDAAIVEDGSLAETGFEINTAPASGDKFTQQLKEITDSLARAGAKVSNSCGLHVHVDARDFSWWELRKLIKVYAQIEVELFNVVSKSRRSSSYCRPCGWYYMDLMNNKFNPRKLKKTLAYTIYEREDIREVRTRKYEEARYNALNLHTWFLRGTVECRMHNGTTDYTKIAMWSLLWANILDWVYTHTEKEIDSIRKSSIEWFDMLCVNDEMREYFKQRRAKFASDSGNTDLNNERS